MKKLEKNPAKTLMVFQGGQTKGDPCNAFGYHGFNGIEQEVVQKANTMDVNALKRVLFFKCFGFFNGFYG